MDFLLTEEQRAFRARLRAWLEQNLPVNWRNGHFTPELDDALRGAALRAWENNVYRAGYAGLHWPTAYGGHGLTLVEAKQGRPGPSYVVAPRAIAGAVFVCGVRQDAFYPP